MNAKEIGGSLLQVVKKRNEIKEILEIEGPVPVRKLFPGTLLMA
jgi:hypothetical protein